ncbi:MAG: VIT domain-containing protein [Planctomycetota bacterium]|nr:VIT domain-containing protein [Planctomycetota bacterium]
MNKLLGLALLGLAACGGAMAPGDGAAVALGSPEGGFGLSEYGLSTLSDGYVDELVILERGTPTGGLFNDFGDAPAVLAPEEFSGTGNLVTELDDRKVVVPLSRTAVKGEVRGSIATLSVTQQFDNPFDHPIEAVYVFPLPHDAAVTDFVMTIGARTIRGVIREREEAEQLYTAAKAQGIAASLMTQERPNVFTQKVANIAPGGSIDVSIDYMNRLPYRDGWYELAFPMVVGPRYNPAGSPVGIGAVTLASRGASGQLVEVPYLRPDERSGHDITFELDLDAGMPIAELVCDTHVLEIARPSDRTARIALTPFDQVPNRDLVLRYRPDATDVRTSLLVTQDAEGGYAHLTLLPPADLDELPTQPMELIFVVDTSGSMEGRPMRQAQAAIQTALDRLTPADTFRVIRFSNGSSQLAEDPLRATPENVARARRFVNGLEATGGTEMLTGLVAALQHAHDPGRQRMITFLTDGYIGNDRQILGEVRRRVGSARIFSLGVGSSVNRFLLEGMAVEGRGAVAFLGLKDDPVPVMTRVLERIRRPALTDLEIDWQGLAVTDVFPSELPDLMVGRPIEVLARFEGPLPAEASVRVLGRTSGSQKVLRVSLGDPVAPRSGAAMAKLWARAKIADLASQSRRPNAEQPESYARRIQAVALEHGLLSAYTAFLAVDSMSRVSGEAKTVPVAVPVPDGVNFDTTVQDAASDGEWRDSRGQ